MIKPKSYGFHRLCWDLYQAAAMAGVLDNYDGIDAAVRALPLCDGMSAHSRARYVRVVSYVHPEILEQWTLKIPRDRLAILASMTPEEQLAQFRTMTGARNIIRPDRRMHATYAEQVIELLRAGLSGAEIAQVVELLAQTDVNALRAALKNHTPQNGD